MSGISFYYFGIEIEAIVEPHKIRTPLQRAEYYQRLADALKNRGLEAKADDLRSGYRKHAEHYDKWWITKDGSLGNPDHPCIPLEAVSPKLSNYGDWVEQIENFWDSMRAVFHMPKNSMKCGSHIHISPEGRNWSLEELKSVAFGIIFFEPLISEILPETRRGNPYCQFNTLHSPKLMNLSEWPNGFGSLCTSLYQVSTYEGLKDIMQSNQDKYVLWNFANILGPSGTVEFRGGRCLRGPIKTLRWVAFTVAFIEMVLQQKYYLTALRGILPDLPAMEEFWEDIKAAASHQSVSEHLPYDYRIMNETVDEGYLYSIPTYENDLVYIDSDQGSIISKDESIYSDSNDRVPDFYPLPGSFPQAPSRTYSETAPQLSYPIVPATVSTSYAQYPPWQYPKYDEREDDCCCCVVM